MRLMYDALVPSRIPKGVQMVASYVDGGNAPPPGWQNDFPGSVIVEICREPGLNHGNVIDCETATAVTPPLAADWVGLRRRSGAIPSVYVQASKLSAVLTACEALGLEAPGIWEALWNDSNTPIAGAYAHQFAPDGIYDRSIVADVWPGVAGAGVGPVPPIPPPAPVPPPQPYPFPSEATHFEAIVQVPAANVRRGISTSTEELHLVYKGDKFTIDRWAWGQSIYDHVARQLDYRWYHIYDYGWIASAMVAGNAPGTEPRP